MKKGIIWRAVFLSIMAAVISLAIGQAQSFFIERWAVSCSDAQGQVREESVTWFYTYENAREWALNWAVIDSTLTCKIETVYRRPGS